jgi:hypothetical protein
VGRKLKALTHKLVMKNTVSLQRGDQRGQILNPESDISYEFLCLIFFFYGFCTIRLERMSFVFDLLL